MAGDVKEISERVREHLRKVLQKLTNGTSNQKKEESRGADAVEVDDGNDATTDISDL